MSKFKVVTPKGASFHGRRRRLRIMKRRRSIRSAPRSSRRRPTRRNSSPPRGPPTPSMPRACRSPRRSSMPLENCKVITLGSVGVDSVDVKAATARGIPVTNIPDTFIEEVADHAMMLLLAGFRRLVEQDKMVRAGPLVRGPPGAPENSAADGADARLHLVRPRGARGGQARRTLRPADDGLRSLHPGDADFRSRRDSGDAVRSAVAVRLRLDARAGAARGAPHARRDAFPADEEERDLHQYRPRAPP